MTEEKAQPMEVNGSESTGSDGRETGTQNVKVCYQCFPGPFSKKAEKRL